MLLYHAVFIAQCRCGHRRGRKSDPGASSSCGSLNCFIQTECKFCLIVLVMTWSSQVSPLPQASIRVSTFTFPAVSSQSDASLVFPILKTRLLSFGTKCSCHYKSGKTPGPVDTDMQEHSLALNSQDSSMTGVYSLLLYPPERNGRALELNYKCRSAKIPGAYHPREV